MGYVYVKTTHGEYKDDRFHFTEEPTRVSEEDLSSVHLENPKLIVFRDRNKPKASVITGEADEQTPESPAVAPESDGT